MSEINSAIYETWMKHIEALAVIGLVTTGRTGSDYIQSLIDGHEEVLGFNGAFLFYEEFVDKSSTMKSHEPDPKDVIDEFVGFFLYKLVSKYDIQEGKNFLGESSNQFFDVDTTQFRRHFIGLVGERVLSSRVCLLAIYGAFHLSIGRSILDTKVFFHHPHLELESRRFISDFPETSIIFTVRDLRANFLSHVENFRKYYPETHDSQGHLAQVLNMGLNASEILDDLNLRSISVRLEDLPNRSTMIQLALWMGIEYQKSLLDSTWAGLAWKGDKISTAAYAKVWTINRTHNNWSNRLSRRDLLLLKCAGSRHLVHLEYEAYKPSVPTFLLALILSLLPMSSEIRYLKPRYLWSRVRLGLPGLIQIADSPLSYVRRVLLCNKILMASLRNSSPTYQWVKIETEVE